MKTVLSFIAVFFFLSYLPVAAQTDTTHSGDSHVMLNEKDLQWTDGPAVLPKGIKVTVLQGDPSKEGPFTMRAIFPANYKIPPHWHPTTENVTVLKGTLYMGSGEQFDEKNAGGVSLGGFVSIPAKSAHFAFTKEECIMQIHAMGPFAITYINPADDPSKQ